MKPINILSLINAHTKLNKEVFDSYLNYYGITIRKQELLNIKTLIEIFSNSYVGLDIYDSFYVGYSIPQISKEFDLLRFGDSYILNIEIKSTNTGDKIKKQLIQNKYYLSFLKKVVVNLTFVADENKIYALNINNEIKDISVNDIIVLLKDQKLIELANIDSLFDPSNYLVSPFNSTEEFVKNNYFLTDHQEEIKNDIITKFNKVGHDFISIIGAAGTGKTLLTYDIAKEYVNSHYSVLIIHCANLNQGQIILREDYKWKIIAIKSINSIKLVDYSIIIIDEVQRIRPHQLDALIDTVTKNQLKCIFSYDAKQCLAAYEMKNNIPEYINSKLSPTTYKLTDKIRTNKEIASFIIALFNLNDIKKDIQYHNVDISYFESPAEAASYLKILENNDWKIINYTPSLYNTDPYEQYTINDADNAHMVIGQEFDKVAAVIDKYFCYDINNHLTIRGYKPYYHTVKMLFQILTRTRKKLSIVIVDNQELLRNCLKIINL
jgi:Ni2+-binding GTPase involved in maturation of urease and hydrogenase